MTIYQQRELNARLETYRAGAKALLGNDFEDVIGSIAADLNRAATINNVTTTEMAVVWADDAKNNPKAPHNFEIYVLAAAAILLDGPPTEAANDELARPVQ